MYFGSPDFMQIKKVEKSPPFLFAPNLTMNLTYLCYGTSKVNGFIPSQPKTRQKTQIIDEMQKFVRFIDKTVNMPFRFSPHKN